MTPAGGQDPLGLVVTWGVPAAAGFVHGSVRAVSGAADRPFAWASVTKVISAIAVWIAVEEGAADWNDPVGPEGSTLRHVLAHASGLAPDSDDVLAPPGRRRIYSNRGFELAADHVAARAAMPFDAYTREAVLAPMGMSATTLGNPAWGAAGPLIDLMALALELQRPTLVAPETLAEVSGPAFGGLPGVLPGFGHQPDNSWGLGVEIRDHKRPHWTGELNSARTFGHFGRSGSFLWIDPDAGVAAAGLADRPFGPWARSAWPGLADAILGAVRSPPPASP